jgi:hypothetical protein
MNPRLRSGLAMRWLAAIAAGMVLYAQAPPAGATFEVASVKPTAGVSDRPWFRLFRADS